MSYRAAATRTSPCPCRPAQEELSAGSQEGPYGYELTRCAAHLDARRMFATTSTS